jgi:hypothetical protein
VFKSGAADLTATQSAYFNMVYAPFSLGDDAWKSPVLGAFSTPSTGVPQWVIRNGLNNEPQTDVAFDTSGKVIGYGTDFAKYGLKGENGNSLYPTANANGAISIGVVPIGGIAEQLPGVYEDNNPWPIHVAPPEYVPEYADPPPAARFMHAGLQWVNDHCPGQGNYGTYTVVIGVDEGSWDIDTQLDTISLGTAVKPEPYWAIANMNIIIEGSRVMKTLYLKAGRSLFDKAPSVGWGLGKYITLNGLEIISVTVTEGPKEADAGTGPHQFKAVVTGTPDPVPQDVIWSVSGELPLAGPTNIDPVTGQLTIDIDEENTELTIKATSSYDPTKFGIWVIRINRLLTLTLALGPGGGGDLTATVNGETYTAPTTVRVLARKPVDFTVKPTPNAGKDGDYTLEKTASNGAPEGPADFDATPLAGATSSLYETTSVSAGVLMDIPAYTTGGMVERSLARLNNGAGGTYCFTMPAYDTTVTAVFTDFTLAGRSFEIRLDADEPVSPQTLGGTPYQRIKGGADDDSNAANGNPNAVHITVKSAQQRTLSLSAQGSLFNLAADAHVELSVEDVTLRGLGYVEANIAGIVFVGAGNRFTMKGTGVTLRDNNSGSYDGCAVHVEGKNARFVMEGGLITRTQAPIGNTSGAVYLKEGGSGVMEGGAITYNYSGGTGAGVRLSTNNAGFVMNGGKISFNESGGQSGGGVSVGTGVFTMSGTNVTISDNIAANGGGGVYVDNGQFIMSGANAMISHNRAASGGGVYMTGGAFTMTGGFIYGTDSGTLANTTTGGSWASVYHNDGTGNGNAIWPSGTTGYVGTPSYQGGSSIPNADLTVKAVTP